MNSNKTDKFEREKLVALARAVAGKKEYIQGGGGNLSVKIGNGRMLIKESGFRFNEINSRRGLVEIDCIKIKKRYADSAVKMPNDDMDFLASCISADNANGARPSMETAFHVFLGKYVLHTHSAYINTLSCSKEGERLFKKAFAGSDFPAIWIPYANPGPRLAFLVRDVVSRASSLSGVFVLQNHGIIVFGKTIKEALFLHDAANKRAKAIFDGWDSYPKNIGAYFKKFAAIQPNFKKYFLKYFLKSALFPDQAVFRKGIECADDGALNIVAPEKQARAIKEILLVWAYIMRHIEKFKLMPKSISHGDIDFIRNMKSERHRQCVALKK
jgi:ribulose-5-phosphate 4-epimerase/fuculose-1-phosphate aldolase